MEYMRQRQNTAAQSSIPPTVFADVTSTPNSFLLSAGNDLKGYDDSALEAAMQAKLFALQNQIPAAEAEADRLSSGISAVSPEALKHEMGGRLGADFSSVRFHCDPSSVKKGDWMGARAWTQGSDVYFGAGGFDPCVAAHELVHTVQQGAVSGTVSESAPAGEVQMLPNPFRKILEWFRRSQADRARAITAQRQQKKPWELSAQDRTNNPFNPGEIEQIEQWQSAIDAAASPMDAYNIFQTIAENTTSHPYEEWTNGSDIYYQDWDLNAEANLDPDFFKAKLKNMARMIHDYPELKGNVGHLIKIDAGSPTVMFAQMSAFGSQRTFNLGYNSSLDERGNPSRSFTGTAVKDPSFAGNHELGHILNYLLFDPDNDTAFDDGNHRITANGFLERAVRSVNPRFQFIHRTVGPSSARSSSISLVDPRASQLYRNGMTSPYGETSASEFFAEAFADVYAHGENARPASIALVRDFETFRGRIPPGLRYGANHTHTIRPRPSPPAAPPAPVTP